MYRIFQNHLERSIFERFAVQSVPIPLGLDRRIADRGGRSVSIQSWSYRCPELRKIRYTYIEAGDAVQIFNSAIYPNCDRELPIFGIDLLSFNGKNLIAMDFQPLFRDRGYQQRYVEPLRELRQRYGDRCQEPKMRFYDRDHFFSKYLFFSRADRAVVETEIFSAYRDYLALYWQLLDRAIVRNDRPSRDRVAAAQRDYDTYNAERDPARGLLGGYFGRPWTEQFFRKFLFADADWQAIEAPCAPPAACPLPAR